MVGVRKAGVIYDKILYEQRVLRHALNDLRNQRLEEGKYTDGVEAAIMEVMKPHRTKHFPW